MMKLKQRAFGLKHPMGALLLTVGLLTACPSQAPTTPPTAAPEATATQPAATEPAAVPDTPTAIPVEPTTPAETPAPDTGGSTVDGPPVFTDSGMAVVENIDVRILESFPVQVQAVVTGYLRDGCTTITGVEAVSEGTTFRIRMSTERPADAMCTMALVPFDQVVPLDVAGLPAGAYQVAINDLAVDFELPDNGAASETPPQPETGAYPVVETTTGYILAQVDMPIYDAPVEGSAEIGLIAGGQMGRVTGASPDGAWWRVMCPDDTVGDCWVTAAPDKTVPTTPPN